MQKPGLFSYLIFIIPVIASMQLMAQESVSLQPDNSVRSYFARSKIYHAADIVPEKLDWKPYIGPHSIRNLKKCDFWMRIESEDPDSVKSALYFERTNANIRVFAGNRQVPVRRAPGAARYFETHLILFNNTEALPEAYLRVQCIEPLHFELGIFRLGSQDTLQHWMMRRHLARFVLGILFVLFSTVIWIMAFIRPEDRKAVLSFVFFVFFMGVFCVSTSSPARLLFPDLLNWSLLSFASVLCIPAPLLVYSASIIKKSKQVWRTIILGFAIVQILVGIYFGIQWWIDPARTEVFINIFFITSVSQILVLLVFATPMLLRGSAGARAHSIGYFILAGTVFYDLLGSHQAIWSWSDYFSPWGTLAFLISIGIVLERRSARARKELDNYARELEDSNRALSSLNKSYQRFVPEEFLKFLKKNSIVEVDLGDNVELELTIMVTDIHQFTALSETMSPEENFDFVNSYLRRVGPAIRSNHGFIAKYMGDGVMALFSRSAQDAVRCSLEIQNLLYLYNLHREDEGRSVVETGIGIHTGVVRLGTVGEEQRMQGDIISDAANLAARMEGLTRIYGAHTVVSETAFYNMDDPDAFQYRVLDRVKVKGKQEPITVFEIILPAVDGSAPIKAETRQDFERAIALYLDRDFAAAAEAMQKILDRDPSDTAARQYYDRALFFAINGAPDNWQGVMELDRKS